MTDWIDANVVVGYLVGQPEEHAMRATRLIDGGRELRIAAVTLAEVGYVLTKVYERPRADVVDALTALVLRENVDVEGVPAEVIVQALAMCRPSGRVDFADAMLWAHARSGRGRVYTFDERFPREDLDVEEP